MVVRRLIYISTINLVLKKAQSLQVIKFVRSLKRLSKKENIIFKAFSLSEVPLTYNENFEVLNCKLSKNRLRNNLVMIYYLLKNNSLNIHDTLYSRDLFLLLIFSLLGIKTIYEYHHPAPFINSILFKIYNFLPKTRLVTISNALKDDFLKNNFWYSKEILVLYSAVEISNYKKLPSKKNCREELGILDNKFYILHTGSPQKGRGIEKFIELCSVSKDIFFIHIGGEESELAYLKNLSEKYKIFNSIFLTNMEEDKILMYQKAVDLLFYIITPNWPTYWCCSPLKIPEYMASGTPILASNIGSITEMIDKKTSFLYDLKDHSLTRNFIKAKSNPDLALKIALSARKKVEKFFTLDVRSKMLIDYFRKLH